MISIGLDLSLTATGVAIINDGELLYCGQIKSKPVGDKPQDELLRLLRIRGQIQDLLDEHCPPEEEGIIVIEGLAFMARNTTALVQLAGLNYLTRQLAYELKVPFAIVAPSSLKKYVTGKGNGDKSAITLELFKQYGVTLYNDNEADAYALATIGQALLGRNKKPLIVPQQEVVDLVKRQL